MAFGAVYGPPFVREGDVRRDGTMEDFRNFARLAQSFGVLDYWLADIRNTIRWHRTELAECATEESRLQRLARLNVLQQVGLLSRLPTVLEAWSRGATPEPTSRLVPGGPFPGTGVVSE